jgi:hypothetical protein
MNLQVGIIIGVFVVLMFAWLYLGSRKKRWYRVYIANNDVMLLSRDLNERWWRTSDRYLRFKDEFGREITFSSNAHWILYWVEVPDNELEATKIEIKRIKEAIANRQAENGN